MFESLSIQEIIIIVVSVLVVILGSLYVYFTVKKAQLKQDTTPELDVAHLLEALGGVTNIISTGLDNKRLKVVLENPKLVSQTLLKSLGIAGFLTGKELKLLVKENALKVKKQLDQLISEGNQ